MRQHYLLTLPRVPSDAENIATAMGCYGSMNVVMLELRGLVCISEMPEETRRRLLDGLEHIENHLVAEVRGALEDAQQRKN